MKHWLTVLGVLWGCAMSATPADSVAVKKAKPSSKNDRWYYSHEPEQRYHIDSTIFNCEEFSMVRGDGIEWFYLGNTGSAAYPLLYSPIRKKGFDAGFNGVQPYRLSIDSMRYYQLKRPYTELMYVIGMFSEQRLNARFANQHQGLLYYGVEFNRIYTKGNYTNQKNDENCLSAYAIYHSKNKQWDVQADFVLNSFRMQENGGATYDVFSDSAGGNFGTNLSSVYLQSANNNYNEIDFRLKANYNIGKKISKLVDTTMIKELVPLFKVGYSFDVQRNQYKFVDKDPDSAYYQSFYSSRDSAWLYFKQLSYSNTLFVEYTGKRVVSDTAVGEVNFITGASFTFTPVQIYDQRGSTNFQNSNIDFYIRSNPATQQKLFYKAAVSWFFSGYNQLDLLLHGKAGYDFGKYGAITAFANYNLQEVPYIYQHLRHKSEYWNYNFPKTNTLEIGGLYENSRYGVLAEARNYILKNMPYFDTVSMPSIETKAVNVLQLRVANRFSIKGFHLDNDLWLQTISGTSKLTLPMFVSRHSVYYDIRIFKKVLWLATGFDLRYNTPFKAYGYAPITGQFMVQNERQYTYYPVLDFFLNFKIKSVRIFLKLENISSYFGPKGYYMADRYPAADLSFKGGIRWRFFE